MSKKEEQALRVFEALSQVDEDLLLRSEKTVEKKNGKVISFHKLNKVLAACLVLFVAGGALFAAQNMRLASNKSAESAMPNFALGLKANNTELDIAKPMEEAEANFAAVTDDFPKEAAEEIMLQGKESAATESNGKSETAREESFEPNEIKNLEADGTIIAYQGQFATLEQVKSGALGKYLPEEIPAGYDFSEAYVYADSDNGEGKVITACWSKGMDDIRINVKFAERESVNITDVADTASYDVNLYEIPYADSVPEIYREAFRNPVFVAKDMSLEVVNRRMKSVQDAGDTATPRGNFSVWFEDTDVLLELNCKAEPEAVWSMIESSCEGE